MKKTQSMCCSGLWVVMQQISSEPAAINTDWWVLGELAL